VSATARTIDVEIPAGDVCLAGRLWLPNRYAGSTAAVMVHGSGAMTRDNDVYFPPIRDALIGAGVAVLGYDKRGVGGSTGDWTTANRLRLLDSMDRLVAAIRAGEPYERRVELMRAVRAQPEGGYLPIMETPEQLGGDQRWWILFDPEPILRSVRCPVLAIFGELDPVVPVGPSIEVFNEALHGAGNHDVTIEVFPGAGHRIEIAEQFAPGYLECLTAWVARRTR
jgi:pimeloyl-ACP methyl ester carboxylesterase